MLSIPSIHIIAFQQHCTLVNIKQKPPATARDFSVEVYICTYICKYIQTFYLIFFTPNSVINLSASAKRNCKSLSLFMT